MNEKIRDALFIIVFAILCFGAGYYCGNRDAVNRYKPSLESARQSFDTIVARGVSTERGLAEIVATVGTITDRNKRIEYLIEGIRATATALREINQSAGEASQALENN